MEKTTSDKKHGVRHFWRNLRRGVLIASILLFGFALFFAVRIFELDAWHELDITKITGADQTLIMYDSQNAELTRLHALEDRVAISIDEVPQSIVNCFVSAEDARFYTHGGIDLKRIIGAAWEDIKAGSYVQGASTISQQLIKLSHLSSEKTMTRKLEEAVLAYELEQACSKSEIMQMYLNYVYFGGGYYGIEAASLGYFGKHASELTVPEGAMLAGILKSPSRYAPHIDIDASRQRRDLIIGLMCEYGYISEEEKASYRAQTPVIIPQSAAEKRGWYADAAYRDALELLGVDSDELLSGGYRIYTAMDASLQSECEAIFADGELFPAADCEGAMVVQEAETGFVRALVGGRSRTGAMGFNRATDIRRQPGSMIKPIIVYAPALEYSGYTAATMLLDEKTDFDGYSPGNAGGRYHGWVTLREAVTRSLNVPAVKTLADIGVETGKAYASRSGIDFDADDASLALALGGFTYGISPMQAAGAYSVFASEGRYSTPSLIRCITDAGGKVLYEYVPENERVLSEANAYILSSMLKSAISEGTGHRLGELELPLAGKTGTVGSRDGNRDAWMAAYNPDYTAAVWMGYDSAVSGSLPDSATGGSYPALILSRLFSYLYPDGSAPDFTMPGNVVKCRLDSRTLSRNHSVVLATALTPSSSVREEVFAAGTEPTAQSDYWSIPLSAGSFSAQASSVGVRVSFTARQSFAIYRIYRKADGEAVMIKEYSGVTGRVSYNDQAVLPGTTYTYYVVPVHQELTIGGERVSGPSTQSVRVLVPGLALGVTPTPSPGITPTPSPEVTPGASPLPGASPTPVLTPVPTPAPTLTPQPDVPGAAPRSPTPDDAPEIDLRELRSPP